LANRIGVTSGIGQYIYNIYFDDNSVRKPGITGNHPYYDQKFKGFTFGAYASKTGFNISKFDLEDLPYYDDELVRYRGVPGFDLGIQTAQKAFQPIPGYFILPGSNLSYENPSTLDVNFSIQSQLGDLSLLTNKLNIFNTESEKIPSIEKEKISSYVRIEFKNPIGLNNLADFPAGFVRDAGTEYFLPYIVQLTAGPNGRQTIQNNAVIIGMDPYGFDVAIKKNKVKNNYSDYKEWGNYWWYTPLNKLRIDNKTKDIHDMSLWAEPLFENEITYYQNNGEYLLNVGEDYTEYDNYSGIIGSILTDYQFTELSSSVSDEQLYFDDFYSGSFISSIFSSTSINPYGAAHPSSNNTSGPYFNISRALDFYKFNSSYVLPFTEKISNKLIVLPKQKEKNNTFKYGSYNLIGSHLHYNTRRSWYDFNYQNKSYLDTIISRIANINGVLYSPNNVYIDTFGYLSRQNHNDFYQREYNVATPTLFKAPDIYAYGGNDFINNFNNSLKLKNTAVLTNLLNQTENTNLRTDDLYNIPGMDLLKSYSENLSIFSDEIDT